MSGFLVSPSIETEWRLDPEEFESRLRTDWPHADVSTAETPDSIAAVQFVVPLEVRLDGRFWRNGQVLELQGRPEESAELAAWFRRIVPPEQELLFYDDGYEVHVQLTEGTTPSDIVAAAEG
jgi:hypothetical protein